MDVAAHLKQPTRRLDRANPHSLRSTPAYLVLLPEGFAVPALLPGRRWALTPPFHPCLWPEGPSAVCSLLHFPSGHPALALPGSALYGVRTFLCRWGHRSDALVHTVNLAWGSHQRPCLGQRWESTGPRLTPQGSDDPLPVGPHYARCACFVTHLGATPWSTSQSSTGVPR